MSERSMSISSGKPAPYRHNITREYVQGRSNWDPSRSAYNTVLINRDLGEVYHTLFDGALEVYNTKQRDKGHPERQISDYLAKMQGDKQQQAVYELVVQIGDRDTNPATDAHCRQVSEGVYTSFVQEFETKFPRFKVVQAVIHVDESTPHLHMQYVPYATGQSRGLETRVSHTQAIKQMGYADLYELNQAEFALFESCAEVYDIERVDMGVAGRTRLDVHAFRELVQAAEREGYPYSNDPALVEVASEALEALQTANDVLVEQTAALEHIAAVKGPGAAKDARETARDVVSHTSERRGVLEKIFQALKDALAGVPVDWREYLIAPITAKLRAHKAAYDERWALDEQTRVYDTSLDEQAVDAKELPQR